MFGRKLFIIIFTGLITLFSTISFVTDSALAGTLTINGNLQPATPKMPVVFISPPHCSGQGVIPVTYRSYPIFVDVADTYTFDLTYSDGSPSFILYENSFDPNDGVTNCVQADNSAPKQIIYPLDTGTTYYLVVFDDTFSQESGAFRVVVDGPGNISMYARAIPTLTEWGAIILSLLLVLSAVVVMRRRFRIGA